MERMDTSDDKDKSKGAINVEDVVVDDVASSTKQDELKNWLPHMMKWSFLSNDEANKKVTYTITCPLDSTLQLLWMLLKRGVLLDEMFSNDSVLLSVLRLIDEGNESSHSVARQLWIDHNAQNGNNLVQSSFRQKLSVFGTISDIIHHCTLFKIEVCSSFSICSVLGEDCMFNDAYKNSRSKCGFVGTVRKSTSVTIVEPKVQLRSIQKTVLDDQYGLPHQVSCGTFLPVPFEDN